MRAIHCFIGCTLFIAGIGSAAATSAETQDLSNAAPAALDSGSASSSVTASGGDVAGLSHDAASSNDSGSSTSSSQGSSHHSGGGTVAPSPSRRPHLGWQSLLPGSIQ